MKKNLRMKMKKNDLIILFLGRIQSRIEDLGALASDTENPLFEQISEFEHFFNKSIQEIFSHKDSENSIYEEGITWKTLPK